MGVGRPRSPDRTPGGLDSRHRVVALNLQNLTTMPAERGLFVVCKILHASAASAAKGDNPFSQDFPHAHSAPGYTLTPSPLSSILYPLVKKEG